MTPGVCFCTFNEAHPKLSRKEPLIVRQAHVHAALDGLDVFSVRCVRAYKTEQLEFGFCFSVKRVSKKPKPIS